MNWINQLGGILEQYTGAAASQAPSTVQDDFDQFAQVAPSGTLADGLSAAFRSDQTPPFGQMVGNLFGQSNGHQRAGILNTLISTLGPTLVAQLLARRGASGLAGLLTGGRRQVTPEEAQQVPPEAVEEIAAQAEKKDPSVIDTLSNFYADHPTLVKTLGGAALAIALASIAQRNSG
ncbi:MAG: hypothetical protein ACLGJB_21205 [Blastocatellia bacterium]